MEVYYYSHRTFRKQRENALNTDKKQAGIKRWQRENTQRTHGEQNENTQCTVREHKENSQTTEIRILRQQRENTQRTRR